MSKEVKAPCDASQVLDVKPEPGSHHCSCEVQAEYIVLEGDLVLKPKPAAPLFFVVDPSRFPDVLVDPDDLSSSCAPLALSSEAPLSCSTLEASNSSTSLASLKNPESLDKATDPMWCLPGARQKV
jgi:hypothetical protein